MLVWHNTIPKNKQTRNVSRMPPFFHLCHTIKDFWWTGQTDRWARGNLNAPLLDWCHKYKDVITTYCYISAIKFKQDLSCYIINLTLFKIHRSSHVPLFCYQWFSENNIYMPILSTFFFSKNDFGFVILSDHILSEMIVTFSKNSYFGKRMG